MTGLDGRSSAHFSFDRRRRHATLLLGRVDFELVVGRVIMTSITGIGMEPLDRVADELLDRRDDASQGMAVVRIAGQRLARE